MLLFKVNYGYKPKTLFILQQAKKISKIAKEKIEVYIIIQEPL